MAEILPNISENLSILSERIQNAVTKRNLVSSKDPCLVAVSKTKPLTLVKQAYDAGQRHFGENYIKELNMKSNNPDIAELCPDIKWHYVGAFQKKMASSLMRVSNLYMLETLHGIPEADAVNKRWQHPDPLKVLVQVNTSGESSKSGVTPEDCLSIASHIHNNCPNLKLSGFMSIGARGHDYTAGPNPDFESLIKCRKEACEALDLIEEEMELSMGMSGDFEEAIEAGSTIIRVGTSIFGARDYPQQQT